MSNRFASCGACARSPTHSRGTSVGKPYWRRSIAVARTQPLVVAPQRITESTPCVTRTAARFVPKNADAPFLSDHVSSRARIEARVDLDPAAADLQVAERRHLLQPETAVLQARLEPDRREDDRQPLRPRHVEQPPRRLDLRREVRAERALRIGEPAGEVDDEHRRPLAQRDALAQPGPRIDLARFLVATCTRPPAGLQLLAEPGALDELAGARLRRRARRPRRSPGRARAPPRARH